MIRAVLFDRDGTLVRDVPYNGDPALVDPMPGARLALDRLRRAGIAVGVVSNQSGVARGMITAEQVAAVNRRVDDLLGPFGAWAVCHHGREDRCPCRKPAPGLVLDAARQLGVEPEECALVGDIGADVDAALAAGARPVLVPTAVTRWEEVAAAPDVAGDLLEAVDRLLDKARKPRVLVARLDSLGDVLLAGPAVRAVAAGASHVTLLCGPRGQNAAHLLPGVDDIICFHAPWIDPEPEDVSSAAMLDIVERVAAQGVDEALILTSFHQSPLPLALLLRMAGVPTIAAVSVDYPGSLLDVRHHVPENIHEVERSLSLAATLGFRPPEEDDRRLAIVRSPDAAGAEPPVPIPLGEYVVVHPGASVPARAWSPEGHRELVSALAASFPVVVTGGPDERELTAYIAGGASGSALVVDAGGALTFAQLAEVVAGAALVVTGNTGPAHLAAAVGTPVVSLYAPTVPAARWRPWGVPHVLLGRQEIGCAGCRAKVCPVLGHPCVESVSVADVMAAVDELVSADRGVLV